MPSLHARLLLCAGAASAACPATQGYPTGATTVAHLTGFDESGKDRTYHVAVPAGYDNTKPTPFLFIWSGLNAPCLNVFSIVSPEAAKRGWITVAPCGTTGLIGTAFNAGVCCRKMGANDKVNDFAFAQAMLKDIRSKLCLDDDRIFSSGFSNGAMMSESMACLYPDTFRAIVSVSGVVTLQPGNAGGLAACDAAVLNSTKRTAVLNIHGTADPMVPYATGDPVIGFPPIPKDMDAWAARSGCTGDGKETFHKGKYNNTLWDTCTSGAQIELVKVVGGGHALPRDADFNSVTYMLDFLDRFGGPPPCGAPGGPVKDRFHCLSDKTCVPACDGHSTMEKCTAACT